MGTSSQLFSVTVVLLTFFGFFGVYNLTSKLFDHQVDFGGT